MKYLSLEEIVAMNYALIRRYSPGELVGVKDMNALEMTVALPKQEVFNKELYPTVLDKAYILFFNLIKKHCFHNANKRTATLALLLFLKRNDIDVQISQKNLEELAIGVVLDQIDKKQFMTYF